MNVFVLILTYIFLVDECIIDWWSEHTRERVVGHEVCDGWIHEDQERTCDAIG